MQLEELKLLVASKLDVTEFLDIIGYTMYDLVEVLDPDVFIGNYEVLMKAVDD